MITRCAAGWIITSPTVHTPTPLSEAQAREYARALRVEFPSGQPSAVDPSDVECDHRCQDCSRPLIWQATAEHWVHRDTGDYRCFNLRGGVARPGTTDGSR